MPMNDKLLKYFHGDEFAASTWENKYALRKNGEIVEQTPDDMHRRLAKKFYNAESKYEKCDSDATSKYYRKREPLTEERIYELFKDFKYVIPAGSVMAGLGSEKPVSLSNCFVLPSPEDSYTSIMQTRMMQVELMKRRGGVGYDLSNLRPRGAAVNNAAITSTGAASFMDVNSDVTNEVSQNGRRGALMMSIDVRHPDVEEFIKKKQDLTKVTGANVSVQVTDDFMEAVESNSDYLLRWPVDSVPFVADVDGDAVSVIKASYDKLEYGKLYKCSYLKNEFMSNTEEGCGYVKKVRAKDIWDEIIECNWNTAEPGIIFKDRMVKFAPDGGYAEFRGVATNPCQPAWATVLTKHGLSTIGEINVGDEIWSEEGWTTVVNKVSSGVKDVHRYRTTGGSFVGTENHKVISNGTKVEVKDCHEIDSLTGPFNQHSDENLDFDNDIIMDGLVIGDGMVHKASNNLIVLCIGKNDTDYFDSEIKDYIIRHRPGIKNCAYEVKTGVKPEELKRKHEIEIPERYMRGTKKEIRSLLRGLYSANGSVVSNRITYKTASKKLCEQIQLLLSAIGINSYYTANKPRRVKFRNGEYECKESYDVNISYDRDKFVSRIGFIQSYKNDKIDTTVVSSRKPKTRKIVSDEIVSTEEVFDITVDNQAHTYWTGGVNVSNCGEIFMDGFNSCRLLAINLLSFVDKPFTNESHLNLDRVYNVTYEAMRLCDDLVDLENDAVRNIIGVTDADGDDFAKRIWTNILDKGVKCRRTGLEFTALSDMIAALGEKFCTKEANEIIEKVSGLMMCACLDCQVDMAIERGAFPSYDIHSEGYNEWFNYIYERYPLRYEHMVNHGRRNISFTTAGPTGSLSILTRTSSGIEPLFMPYYVRRRKCMSENDRVDYVDKMGISFSEFVIVHPQLKEWAKINHPDMTDAIEGNTLSESEWKGLYEESPWYQSCAQDIDWQKRVELQGIVQKNLITHSISSTVNLPNDVTKEEVSSIYMEAWRNGLKGITVYRDGSREGILLQKEQKKEDDKFESYISAPKRPKTLPADFYVTRVKGETFFVMVGLYHEKPYEIFVYKTRDDEKTNYSQHRGEITKIKRGVYKYTSDLLTIGNINGELTTEELATAVYSSMLLRHAAPLDCIIKTAQKVDDNITSFTAAMTRILKKYLKNEVIEGEVCPDCGGKLIRENGCIRCIDCGWSRCG